MNPYDRIIAGVTIALASVAMFVVGLYSSFISFWLATGLMMSLLALMFGGIVLLPRARKTRPAIPDLVIQYLFALVLTFGIVMMFVTMVILGVGLFIWLRFGEYDRVAFAIAEGAPFLLLTIVLWIASFGLLRVRLWAWWQALLGSLAAIAHGIYRYYLSAALIPGNASSVPWFSSNPGGWLTMVLGFIVLVQLIAASRLFSQRAKTAVPSPVRGQITNYSSPHSAWGGNVAEQPTAAFVLSLIGGIFILLGGALIAAIGAAIFAFAPAVGLVLGVIGLAFGILVLISAIMLYTHPEQHVTWGVIILVFSILSIFTALGGFLIGLILGIIGGALAIAWKPSAVPFPGYVAGYPAGFGTYGPPLTPVVSPGYAATPVTPSVPASQSAIPEAPAFCKNCGAHLSPGVQFCPSCGTKVAG